MGGSSSKNNEGKEAGKVVRFFYTGMEQRLRVFDQTEASDIVSALKKALLLAPSQEIVLLDQDGTIVVFSKGQDLPSGYCLYVELKTTPAMRAADLAEPSLEESSDTSFSWDPSSITNSETHFLSNENKTISQPQNESSAGVLSDKVFTSSDAPHYFVLHFDPLQCCVSAGIVPAGEGPGALSSCEPESAWRLWEKMGLDPHGLFPGPKVTAGFILDMSSSRRSLTIVDHDSKQSLACFSIPYESVRVVTFFKHEVSVTIVQSGLPAPITTLHTKFVTGAYKRKVNHAWVEAEEDLSPPSL